MLALQGGQTQPPPAVGALYRAAAVAERRPLAFPADNQFYYVRSVTGGPRLIRADPQAPLPKRRPGTWPTAFVRVQQRQWTSADRVGFFELRTLSIHFATGADRRAWVRAGRPRLGESGTGRDATVGGGKYLLGDMTLSRRALLHFTTNPEKLYRRLYAAGHSPSDEVFVQIADTLSARPVPAPLRAALYRALALVPGIRRLGPTRDAVGRRGIAFALIHAGSEEEMVVDPTNPTVLEDRVIVVNPAAFGFAWARGTLSERTTYLERAVTSTIGAS